MCSIVVVSDVQLLTPREVAIEEDSEVTNKGVADGTFGDMD